MSLRGELALLAALLLNACGGGGGGGSSGNTNTLPVTSANEQAIAIQYGLSNIPNAAYTSVTVCVPSTGQCQTIDNILVDTGSSGLRLMEDALSLALPNRSPGGSAVYGECVNFADGSSIWGTLKTADVRLGQLTAASTPVHVIGTATRGNIPASCAGQQKNTPQAFGANGVLGIGPLEEDCGTACSNAANNGQYFSCPSAGSCSGAAVPLAAQVGNPVARLPLHNNGTLIRLPAVSPPGTTAVSGTLVFGIQTASNNTLGSVRIFPLSYNGAAGLYAFTTQYKGQSLAGFIDSGSNGLFFDDPDLPICALSTSFYCPLFTQTLFATQVSQSGPVSVSFAVSNIDTLDRSLAVIPGLAGPEILGAFDWGLPFFYGRPIFTAIEGKATAAGPGPYFAF